MKNLYIFLTTLLFFSYTQSTGNYALSIIAVENNSDATVTVGRTKIAPEQCSDALTLPIPFVSFFKNHDAFIQSLPYFPDNALVIKAGHVRWGIWEEERGIICAAHPQDTLYPQHSIPGKAMFRIFNRKKPKKGESTRTVYLVLHILKNPGNFKPLYITLASEDSTISHKDSDESY